MNSTKPLNTPKYTEVYGDTMVTTIKLHDETKHELDHFREYKNESYDELVKKMIYIAKNCRSKPQLSKEAVIAIDKARKRIKEGRFVTEDEAKRRLGL